MRPVFLLATIALLLSPPQASAATASASAWGYGGSDSQSQLPTAGAHFHGTGPDFPGYTDGTTHARLAWLDGVSTMFGCGTNAGFQQVCNDGGTVADWSDVIEVLASAPNGTPVDVQVTLALAGTIDGRGGYSYAARGTLRDQSRAISATTGGTVQTVQGLSINDTRVWTMTLAVGDHYDISGHLDTQAFNRICAGGTNECSASISEWTLTVSAVTSLRFQVLSPLPDVHLVGQDGHDYLDTPTAVAPGTDLDRFKVTSANPASGPVTMALQLAEPSDMDVAVFDVAGRRIATLASGAQPAGTKILKWDGRDVSGRAVRGVCFVRARGRAFSAQSKIVMLR
jgi:hypothetical protein